MKFGKKLRATVDTSYEEWRPMFMSYKDLKKCIAPRLRATAPGVADVESRDSASKDDDDDDDDDDADDDHDSDPDRPAAAARICWDEPAQKLRDEGVVRDATRTHHHFFARFRLEVDKVNDFFLDKQEDYIIEHHQLSAKVHENLVPGRPTRTEINRLRQRLTNFHGELVLLENFSTVNYTGFRKILKKHDKKTGLNLRNIYLKTVLITPFFLSDTVRKLILSTEAQLAELDTIRKFRRHSPASALSIEAPSPSSLQLPTLPQPSSKNASSSKTPPSAPAVWPCTQVVMDPPRPHAFISPRCALWHLYSAARAYATQLREAMRLSPRSKQLPKPPQSMIDLVDAMRPTELGLVPMFLNAVSQPSNYRIAGEEGFSMGFFVFGPGTKLQIFKADQGGLFITKNLYGRARMHWYRTRGDESSSTVRSPQTGSQLPKPDERQEQGDLYVKRMRSAVTNGPWPAVTCQSSEQHVEWVAETVCAVFYVCSPALGQDELARFDLQALSSRRFRAVRDADNTQRFTRVMC